MCGTCTELKGTKAECICRSMCLCVVFSSHLSSHFCANLCLFGSVTRTKRPRITRHCTAAERLPREGPSPSLSSRFAQSESRVLIRKRWLLNPLFSPQLFTVDRVNQSLGLTCAAGKTSGISGDQYQDWPALPVWIRYSRKFANSLDTLGQTCHAIGERLRGVSGVCCAPTHLRTS